MFKSPSAPIAAVSYALIRDIVSRLHQRGHEPLCCDPRDLAESVGLAPCPERTQQPFVRGNTLFYPDHLGLPERGAGIYWLLAERLFPAAQLQMMRELILPEAVSLVALFGDLATIQPHAPLGLVQSLFMLRAHRRSGVVALT